MYYNIVNTDDFKEVMSVNFANIISLLVESETEFGILVDMKAVEFEPELPSNIELRDPSFFILANYTLQSVLIEDDIMKFEAGFGEDGFGAVVSVPLLSILQISIEDKAIAINMSPAPTQKPKKKEAAKDNTKSLNAFAANPENAKFFKK
ncbi:MAG: hypothetical protein ACQESH_03290 [Campylobacterota bacterium]